MTTAPRGRRRREPALLASEIVWLRRLLKKRSGVVLDPEKSYLAEMRLATLAHAEGFGSMADLLDSLRTEEEWGLLHRKVVDAMMVTETSFFRDLYTFQALRTAILPQLIERRAADRTLHIWCAACASGQEPYSIAMLIRDHFPQLLNWNLRLIGSDVSETMLTRARAGIYSQIEVNRGLPAPLLVRHFEQRGDDWRVRDPIRRMVEYRDINLSSTLPALPPMDIVLLRNVLIYFDGFTRRAVLESVARCLRPDGTLILGGGEATVNLDRAFEAAAIGRAVTYRLRRAA